MAASRHRDSLIYEHLSSDVFWLLGIALILLGRWTNKRLQNSIQDAPKPDIEADKVASEGHSSAVTTTLTAAHRSWLQAWITSRFRKLLAVIVYLVILSLQLLEGYWILQTAWRITIAVFTGTFPPFRPYILALLFYLPVVAVTLASWVGVLMAGVYLVSMQYIYIYELCQIPRPSHARPRRFEEPGTGDGKWADLETGRKMQGREEGPGGVLLGEMEQ